MRKFILVLVLVAAAAFFLMRKMDAVDGQADRNIAQLVESVRAASYPQLKDEQITLGEMHSDYIYFESRFQFSSFFSHKLRYLILFNPLAAARQVPREGLRAIAAHELAHIDYYYGQSRMGLVGLVRLVSAPFAARFERGADLEAIALGYGPGLASYRTWLYQNVPPSRMEEKKRDYFSPEEIAAILHAAERNPQVMRKFAACVPRNLAEIMAQSHAPEAPCSN